MTNNATNIYQAITKGKVVNLDLSNGKLTIEFVSLSQGTVSSLSLPIPGATTWLWDELINLMHEGKGLDGLGECGAARRRAEAEGALAARKAFITGTTCR